ADEHPASTVTATPVFYQGRLYVGSASREEALSVSAAYACCTFRGSETALEAASGKVLWKRYMIPEAAKERSKGRHGSPAGGPSGVGVWTAPPLWHGESPTAQRREPLSPPLPGLTSPAGLFQVPPPATRTAESPRYITALRCRKP